VSFIGLYVFTRLAGGVRYYADFSDVREEIQQADGFIHTASDGRHLVRLDARMKGLLTAFAKRYPAVKLLGVNQWEGRNSPLSRKQYKEVLDFLDKIKATRPKDGGGKELNDFGNRQIPKWATGVFDDVIRLAETSPTPSGA
jgi:hypothetical protein